MNARYIKRAIKQLVYFTIIVLIITLLVYNLSDHSQVASYKDLFANGSGIKILFFLLLFSLIYPMFGYAKKEVGIKGSLSDNYNSIISAMRNCHFEVANDDARKNTLNKQGEEVMVFRHKNSFTRLMRLYEDTITIVDKGNGFIEIEGLRKEIVRVAGSIERTLFPNED